MKNLQEVRDLLTEKLDGKTLQYRVADGWDDIQEDSLLCFLNFCECRAKPESKPDIVRYCHIPMGYASLEEVKARYGTDMFRYVIDGDTGKVKSVEVVS